MLGGGGQSASVLMDLSLILYFLCEQKLFTQLTVYHPRLMRQSFAQHDWSHVFLLRSFLFTHFLFSVLLSLIYISGTDAQALVENLRVGLP